MILEVGNFKPLTSPFYFSTRIIINGVASLRAFTSYSTSLFKVTGDIIFSLCSELPISSSNQPNYDILNFIWFQAPAGAFNSSGIFRIFVMLSHNTSLLLTLDASCLISMMVNLPQIICLQCKPSYYQYEMQCVSSCPRVSVLHMDTQSCQSKYPFLIKL